MRVNDLKCRHLRVEQILTHSGDTPTLGDLGVTEAEVLDGVTAGTVTASKAAVVDSNKDIGDFRNVDVVNLDAGASGTAGTVDVFPATASRGKLAVSCTNQTGDTIVSLVAGAMAAARTVTLRDPGAAASLLTTTDATAAAVTATAVELSILSGVTATGAEINTACDQSAQVLTPGAGISAGVGTVYKSSIVKQGDIFKTTIFLDLTGLASTTTDTDIIGTAGVCHLGQITAAKNGTIFFGQVTCLETPATGADDVAFHSSTVGTGAYDADVTALAGAAVLYDKTSAASGAAATQIALTALPAANTYLYIANGEAGTVGTYTAGQFLIELWGA